MASADPLRRPVYGTGAGRLRDFSSIKSTFEGAPTSVSTQPSSLAMWLSGSWGYW